MKGKPNQTIVKPPKLRLWHYLLLVLSLLALWVTGLAWVWLHYFGEVEGEFGPSPNPLQPLLLSLHGFFLLPALLAMGGIMVAHAVLGWRYAHKRVSGLVQSALYFTLILTGYGLYYAGDDLVRENISLAHWLIGAGAPVIFLWHLIAKVKRA